VRRTGAGLAAAGLATAVGVLGVLGVPAPASAHVTANPVGEAVPGGSARVDFRVPTEGDTESTVGVEVHFPEETPIASVSAGAMPGWTVEVTMRTLDQPLEGAHGAEITEVVESIAWTAEGEGIPPGQFGEFPVTMRPLPEVEELAFPTLQTYSDGAVVRWIELEGPAGEEPESPAPTLTLTGGSGDAGEENGSGGGSGAGPSDGGSGDRPGTWLGLAGLVAGLAGLALGGVAFTRTRRARPARPGRRRGR
jgi:uncharacterized protein YcnI